MIRVYKTFEIDDKLWEQIAEGFSESFNKSVRVSTLKNGFCIANQWGYGFHAIDIDDETGEVRGFNTYSPTLYRNGLKVLVSGSTYVRPKYRKDIFIFSNLVKELRKRGKQEGFDVSVGVPNHNSRNYALKILKNTYVDDLDYYILPINASVCLKKEKLRVFDGLIRAFLFAHVRVQYIISYFIDKKEKHVKYELDTSDAFFESRFKTPVYSKIDELGYKAYYRLVNEEGKNVAYLMDFRYKGERTRKALTKIVLLIWKKEKPDAILFVGFLHLCQHTLFKIPHKFIPKPLPLTFFVLDKDKKEVFEDMRNRDSWNFSLLNFDVR